MRGAGFPVPDNSRASYEIDNAYELAFDDLAEGGEFMPPLGRVEPFDVTRYGMTAEDVWAAWADPGAETGADPERAVKTEADAGADLW